MFKKVVRKKFIALFLCVLMSCSILTGCLDDDEYYDDYDYEDDNDYDDDYDDDYGNSSGSGSSSSSVGGVTSTQNVSFEDVAIREHNVVLKGNGEDTVTVLMYVNGSNLESDDNEATTDLLEAISGAGSSDKVNFIVQTMGTKKWSKKLGIAADRSQRYKLDKDGLTLIDDSLGQLDCTSTDTFRNFIVWGAQNYPADRYILLFWDHGGGPVYGFGYDEWQDDDAALTMDEIQTALKDAGVYFDFIGMDCCLMSSLEVCLALYDYCDYTILSEDFESGMGWAYKDWVSALYNNSSISTPELGKMICDDMVNANANSSDGDKSIMALIDQCMMKVLYTAWRDFAYANENKLLNENYSRRVVRTGRALPRMSKGFFSDNWDYLLGGDEEDVDMADYYVTDIMAVSSNIESDESDALNAALKETLIYVTATDGDAGLTGISVTLPYGDSSFYSSLKSVFTNVGMESEYITWLQKFTSAQGSSEFYDYDDWDDDWTGWDDYDDDYDWSDWEYYDDDDYWSDDDLWGWDFWDYDDSWNEWYEEDDWNWDDESDDWCYEGDDWYYEDDDWYDDGWFY